MRNGMESEKLFTRADTLDRALAAGAGLLAGAVLAEGLAATSASAPSQDVAVLNFALAFEELQADFYARVLKGGKLTGDWLQFAQVVGAHEQEHVKFLRAKLGAAARPSPVLTLTSATLDPARFHQIVIDLEDAGVGLYNGQAANLSSSALAAAAEIVSVEARHAAWARDLAGQSPAPAATDKPVDVAQVRTLLAGIGVEVTG